LGDELPRIGFTISVDHPISWSSTVKVLIQIGAIIAAIAAFVPQIGLPPPL
jgi:hypothetical protein